jgi:hypothetical protein
MMHILTGLVLAGLFGKGGGAARSPLLSSGGPIRTVHLLPGRVRFQSDVLRGDPAGGEKLAERLAGIEGVGSAAANPVSGSVLIRYDEQVVQAELLFVAIVRLLGLEREVERAPTPALARGLRQSCAAANRAVYEQTGGLLDLWTAVPLVLGFIGLQRIASRRSAVFPAGLTMVWWAYSALLRGAHPGR